jgi:hypothetical protein
VVTISAVAAITAMGPTTNGAADKAADQIPDTTPTPVNTDEGVPPACNEEQNEEVIADQ